MNRCGECNACCKVFHIPALEKPAGKWCQHCDVGKSCRIYEDRPQACSDFECIWLQSQVQPGQEWGPELRPDKCKVVFAGTTNSKVIAGVTLPGSSDAWKKTAPRQIIDILISAGIQVVIHAPLAPTAIQFGPDGTVREIEMSEPDGNGVQWNLTK